MSLDAFANCGIDLVANPLRQSAFDPGAILEPKGFAEALATISGWDEYEPTPLLELSGLAGALHVDRIVYKDEGSRFGLGSFKALGGAYAVGRQLEGKNPSTTTVATATDGNHGRAVAWGAKRAGCKAVVYVHARVTRARIDAIAELGAEVVRVMGNYDDAVRRADRDSRANDWTLISDTSYLGYTRIPRDIAYGYGVLMHEVRAVMGTRGPTHIFVQAGVGGLAASVCAGTGQIWGPESVRIVVVEADAANCCFRSALAGKITVVDGELDTIMAGLACGQPSLIAWDVLHGGADAFVSIDDRAAEETMRLLARSPYSDPGVEAGESAVAGLAALILAARNDELRATLEIDSSSTALVFGTECATDPSSYAKIVASS